MKRLFNQFMKDHRSKVLSVKSHGKRAAKASILFNRWMMATMKLSRPTEFANAFMVRKWLNKLTA